MGVGDVEYIVEQVFLLGPGNLPGVIEDVSRVASVVESSRSGDWHHLSEELFAVCLGLGDDGVFGVDCLWSEDVALSDVVLGDDLEHGLRALSERDWVGWGLEGLY